MADNNNQPHQNEIKEFQYESDLEHQIQPIQAAIDIFEGLPNKQGTKDISHDLFDNQMSFAALGSGNRLMLSEDQLLKNLHTVQERNLIPKSKHLVGSDDNYEFPNFSVEMETGTGKTYVYLRTIFELNRKYGYSKFIIVVPSVAIREGILTSIESLREHLSGLYDNTPYDYFVYRSEERSKVAQFARNNTIQIMIINIQAFQKDLNIINQEQDMMAGRRPIEYIQTTNPIIIIDEPQSVDNTIKAKKAISTLNPLFCLRYSATHFDPYNLIYKLDPIKAYEKKLVKQIEVSSIYSDNNYNEIYLRLNSVGYAKGAKKPHAVATILEDTKTGPKEKRITLKQGTEIDRLTNREGYDGYRVDNIWAEEGFEYVEFANGKKLTPQEDNGLKDDILKAQVEQAVEEHFKKEKKFHGKGFKILTLFFIDRVANYRTYDVSGNQQKGKIAEWFEEAYAKLSQREEFKGLLPYDVVEVHNGYFSTDKKRGNIVALKDTSGSTRADDETYNLIMRDKKRLLSPQVPLRFIFSHSALKEGWDNPNVFQLCTLREMGSERERRQTLGRGLRLPVDSDGKRIYDENINKLTVIAGESFEQYARGLQADMERDIGDGFKFGRIGKIAFAHILDLKTGEAIGQAVSEKIWEALVAEGYLDDLGDITNKFNPENAGFVLDLPKHYESLKKDVLYEMKRYIFQNRIVNARDRRMLKYNKRIELNQDFNDLWKKISKKTRYTVEFDTDVLIGKAAERIKDMPVIEPVKIYINKTELDISKAGLGSGRLIGTDSQSATSQYPLPDILLYLQKETELTRGTLADILIRSERLKEFTVNPQAFMTETAKLINRVLNELTVDGIKYEIIKGEHYEMRLFEEKEIEGYLNKLYEVQSNDDRTPYDYVMFDSVLEKEISEKLDQVDNVKFFCKLPQWFKIPTPLGSYNPDWAIVTEQDEKLYLVRETKSTHNPNERRPDENINIACGNAHFKELGVNYKVATTIHEVLGE